MRVPPRMQRRIRCKLPASGDSACGLHRPTVGGWLIPGWANRNRDLHRNSHGKPMTKESIGNTFKEKCVSLPA